MSLSKKWTYYMLLLVFFACSFHKPTQAQNTEILWDSWGVPHIYAQNNRELFFAFGWAQMHSHGNLLLELYGKSRGRAAEYWGEDYLENDMLVHTLGFPELSKKWSDTQDPEMKTYFEEFARGVNAYAQNNPKAIQENKKIVLPVRATDIAAHYLFLIYTRFVGGDELGNVEEWAKRGSNTYAIAPSRSASGKAMLVQNPHLPWWGEFLFYEAHLNAPGVNMYGATLVGFPTLGIAFNENLGWSHTNNTIDNADSYELTLKDGGYVLDGTVKQFDKYQKTIQYKDHEGKLQDKKLVLLRSVHGPVLFQKDEKALAIRFPGFDRPNTAMQWWQMGKAKNFEEFETALKQVQIPFFNVMYADKAGNIFYMFNGQVPVRASGDWNFWNSVIPGDQSEYVWTKVHPYEDLPKIKNPAQGWLQNANDPPWTSTFPMLLKPENFPPYMSPVRMEFRPQRSVRMLAEDEKITFEELQAYKLSTRMEFADRILDDLFAAIDQYGNQNAKEAKKVLEAWDREADADSKGAWLFYNWARKLNLWSPDTYTQAWSIQEARTTPDGLAKPEQAVRVLEEIVNQFKEKYGKLDVAWGDVYRIRYNGMDLPGNGADGGVGVFRVAWPGGRDDDKLIIGGGDSWVGIIEFGDQIRAKVLLSYGNSTQPGSPHYGDQLKLFSKKEMRDAWFYKADVEKNLEKREVLEGDKLVEK